MKNVIRILMAVFAIIFVLNGSIVAQFSENIEDCPSKFVDLRDGKVYNTIQIDGKCWMAENLNYGKMVKAPSDYPFYSTQVDNSVAEKYCYNNESINCIDFGGLYTWHELMNYSGKTNNQGLCPEGWHVPSKDEWKTVLSLKIIYPSLEMSYSNLPEFYYWDMENGKFEVSKSIEHFWTSSISYASLNRYSPYYASCAYLPGAHPLRENTSIHAKYIKDRGRSQDTYSVRCVKGKGQEIPVKESSRKDFCEYCNGKGRIKEKVKIWDPCPVKIRNSYGSHLGCKYCGGDGKINERYVDKYVKCEKCKGTGRKR